MKTGARCWWKRRETATVALRWHWGLLVTHWYRVAVDPAGRDDDSLTIRLKIRLNECSCKICAWTTFQKAGSGIGKVHQ